MIHIFTMFKRKVNKVAKNLFDFGNEEVNNGEFEEKSSNKNKNIDEITNTYNKYKNLSQDELIKEFLSTSKQKLNEGSLTIEGLQKTVENLSPFLNSEQMAFLKGIINKLNG